MKKVICVEGFKAFRGVMMIERSGGTVDQIYGEWLYKPDCDCWYCSGCSYQAAVCSIWEVE